MPQVAFQPRKRSHKDHHEDKETERPKKRFKHSPTPRERTASSGENEYIPSQLMTEPTIEHLTAYHLPNVVGGEVYYVPEFVSRSIADRWYATLEKECPWYHPTLKLYGKEVSQSRSISAYSTEKSLSVKYSGHVVNMEYNYSELLTEIQNKVEAFVGQRFNHVLLNKYQSGSEYIGKHRDTKENKLIISLSLGAQRTFIMTPSKSSIGIRSQRLDLSSGSLLIMGGQTQENWKHEIPKEPHVREGRISLTFRQIREKAATLKVKPEMA